MMTLDFLTAISPLLALSVAVLVTMLLTARARGVSQSAWAMGMGYLAAMACVVWLAGWVLPSAVGHHLHVGALLQIDRYGLVFAGMALIGGFVCNWLGLTYLAKLPEQGDEFFMLIGCSTMGAVLLAFSVHMASLFVGLELMSVPLYGLAAYLFFNRLSMEAGIKYLVLSAMATCFLLFGMAVLYAASGTLSLNELVHSTMARSMLGWTILGHVGEHPAVSWVLLAIAMMVIGLGFKLSIVPFHFWTPDVYEGAPMPVTAFLATVSKLAVFSVLLRVVLDIPFIEPRFFTLLSVLAVFSMLGGNLLALFQKNIKRILGYSSIAHLGYLMITLVAAGGMNQGGMVDIGESIALYLGVYMLTALGTFCVMTQVSSPWHERDAARLDDYRGLFWSHPYQAASLSLMMISMAGVPLTAGFIGKLYVASVAMDAHLWVMMASLVLGSAIGLYYYLRVMVVMFLPARHSPVAMLPAPPALTGGGVTSAALLCGIVITLITWVVGLYPTPLMALIGHF